MTRPDSLPTFVLLSVFVCCAATLHADPPSGGKWKPVAELTDEFHGDKLDSRELKNTHWHQPLNMNFDSETMPEWFGLPDKESLPSTFSIEYVRSWRSTEDAEPDGPANGSQPIRPEANGTSSAAGSPR